MGGSLFAYIFVFAGFFIMIYRNCPKKNRPSNHCVMCGGGLLAEVSSVFFLCHWTVHLLKN
jgi:hypothetical protein